MLHSCASGVSCSCQNCLWSEVPWLPLGTQHSLFISGRCKHRRRLLQGGSSPWQLHLRSKAIEQNSPNVYMLFNLTKHPASYHLMTVGRQCGRKTVGHTPLPCPTTTRAQRCRAHTGRHSIPSLEYCPLNRIREL